MKMKLMALCLVSLMPLSAFAEEPRSPEQEKDRAARRERTQKRHRMMQVVGLAEALDLSTEQALRMGEVIRTFDDRRRPLHEQVMEASRTLRQAADGDRNALGQVDQATSRLLDARMQLAALDKEMFNALSRDLSPQKRAQMAVFFAQFQRRAKSMPRIRIGGPDPRPMIRMRAPAHGPFGQLMGPDMAEPPMDEEL
jgi:hypothetical protein